MVGFGAKGLIRKDSSLIFDNGFGINGGRHGTADQNFRHDFFHDIVVHVNHTVFCNSGVGEIINFGTGTSHTGKRVAGAASVGGTARSINLGAESIRRVFTTSQISHAGIIGNISHLLDEFIGTSMVTPVARSGFLSPAVQNVLNTQINIIALSQASDLDAVRKAAQGSVRPATSAVLRNVLIERVCEVGNAIDVAPRETVGELRRVYIFVRQGRRVIIVDSVLANLEQIEQEVNQMMGMSKVHVGKACQSVGRISPSERRRPHLA